MPLDVGTPELNETTKNKLLLRTNFKVKKEPLSTSEKWQKLKERSLILAKKNRAKMRLANIAPKKKSNKRKFCLECLIKPRAKKRLKNDYYTKCKSCLLKYDVGYWGEKAWEAFAKYLKAAQVTFQGYFTCYTCDKTFDIDRAQAGHCFHRGNQHYKALDFDPLHIHLQCGGCNMDNHGEHNKFQANLTREIGAEAVEQMIWRRHNEPALTIPELQEIIKHYSELLKTL